MKNEITYLDSASTTKTDPRVLKEMLPYFTEYFGNASSSHSFGKLANEAIEEARTQVAEIINCDNKEIIFTSGATESINMAIKGYVESNPDKGNHIITVKTEHKAVLSTCEYLETKGFEVTYLDVDKNGVILFDQLRDSVKENTSLVVIMHVNNETGIIQPIKEIGEFTRENNIAFFCDATQSVGKIKVDIEDDYVDMLCFSGHKLNGPKGIGVLYKRKNIELTPLIHGGGQEKGLRGGTYNTPLIVGLGKACEIACDELKHNIDVIEQKSKFLIQELKKIKDSFVVGNQYYRASNIIDVIVPELNSDIIISKIPFLALSNGSACTSQIIESSHVLKAMGFTDAECSQSLRISIDKTISLNQIIELVEIIQNEVKIK
ncbi:cysteine desulfurase family protein [Algibacter sp. TI.3.09]|uniref:cysteine desulfurase family protein n=1 Tax=Algibacter sp. TI.3.09 TaxID=3121298 RepID=UPI00311E3C82